MAPPRCTGRPPRDSVACVKLRGVIGPTARRCPCAYPVLLSRGALTQNGNCPTAASESAARCPATPLPITRKSVEIRHDAILQRETPATRVDVVTGSHTSAIWVGGGSWTISVLDWMPRRGVEALRGLEPAHLRHHGRGPSSGRSRRSDSHPRCERHKTLASCRHLRPLIRGGADRGSTLVAVGRRVVGDTAGFAARASCS